MIDWTTRRLIVVSELEICGARRARSSRRLPDERRLWQFLEGVKGWRFSGKGYKVCGPGDGGNPMESAQVCTYIRRRGALVYTGARSWSLRRASFVARVARGRARSQGPTRAWPLRLCCLRFVGALLRMVLVFCCAVRWLVGIVVRTGFQFVLRRWLNGVIRNDLYNRLY